ncbi:MAG: lasso peptide biosynthesis B2 protein [Gemmatimonadales bacterium]
MFFLRRVYRIIWAQGELLRARHMLRHRPVGALVQVVNSRPPSATDADIVKARDWALAVSTATRYGLFRPKCLVRSLALVRLLDRAGIHGARIRAGVQLHQDQFTAHAWVELGDIVLSDPDGYVARFEPWADLRVFEELSR